MRCIRPDIFILQSINIGSLRRDGSSFPGVKRKIDILMKLVGEGNGRKWMKPTARVMTGWMGKEK